MQYLANEGPHDELGTMPVSRGSGESEEEATIRMWLFAAVMVGFGGWKACAQGVVLSAIVW